MRGKDKGETANTHTQWLWNGKKQEEAAHKKKWLEQKMMGVAAKTVWQSTICGMHTMHLEL